mmetsp:Transcript_24861/g.36670  ORF Transcript_24861/g.36670 Transcript_24861/m.36670 type:complete len:279 (-) Transcript_24861:59-895(-)
MSQFSNNQSVRSTASSGTSGSDVYESERAVHEYLLFHYGSPDVLMPYKFGPSEATNFPARTSDICLRHASQHNRALDIGCAVGASAFELSKSCNEVVGIDFSHNFIAAANLMKGVGTMQYSIMEQGKIFSQHEAKLPVGVNPDRVTFSQGDACNLSTSLGTFDIIHASNLLCRLPDPGKFLAEAPHLLNPGGILVLVSPYSWLEEYTPVDKWIGGKVNESGEPVDSASALQQAMEALSESTTPIRMTLIHSEDVPFLIREHSRKFQYGVSHCMIWKRE